MTTRKTTTPRKRSTTTARKTATKSIGETTGAADASVKKPVSGALDGALEAAKALSAGRRGAGDEAASQGDATGDVAGNEGLATLRKKEFIDAVARRSGVKRGDAKTAVEAALAELGEAIAAGRHINLPGFGKLKVNRAKHLSNAEVFVTKIRQPKQGAEEKAQTTPKDPLAEAAE